MVTCLVVERFVGIDSVACGCWIEEQVETAHLRTAPQQLVDEDLTQESLCSRDEHGAILEEPGYGRRSLMLQHRESRFPTAVRTMTGRLLPADWAKSVLARAAHLVQLAAKRKRRHRSTRPVSRLNRTLEMCERGVLVTDLGRVS